MSFLPLIRKNLFLVIFLALFSFGNLFFIENIQAQADQKALVEGINNPLTGNTETLGFAKITTRIINWIFGLVGVAALLLFMYGGFQYLTSMGDAKKADAGKNTVIWAVIGLAVIFGSYVALDFVLNTIGITEKTQQPTTNP